MSMPFGPPVQVSPLIRGARFALLIAGFFYGVGKQALYTRMEAAYQVEEAERKIIRDREMAAAKAKLAKEEQEVIKQLERGKF